MAFTPFSYDMEIIAKLSDTPNVDDGLTAYQLKEKFDEGGRAVKDYINNTLLEEVAEKPSDTGLLKSVDGKLVAAEAGKDYQAPIGEGEVGADMLSDGSVTRSKLATDALYSPITYVSEDRDIAATDLGYTLIINKSVTLTVSYDALSTLPAGAEIAVIGWVSAGSYVKFSGNIQAAHVDGNIKLQADADTTIKLPMYGMIALKKVTSAILLVTGNVEVVS
jgi:hypothetical protein